MPGVESGHPYAVEDLRTFSVALFEHAGVPTDEARLTVDAMLDANLRGLDTHGVTRMLPIYLRRIEAGVMAASSRVTVVRERAATAVLDGHHSIGQVVARTAMQMAMDKASSVGTGCVGVRDMSHFGAAGHWSAMALARDQVGIAMCNTPPFMAPTGGCEARLGTNPFSVAIPGGREGPVLVDMATTAVARGRIALFEKQGLPVPEGWALGPDGASTTNASAAMAGTLLPMAGPKGYGLALIIDLLAGLMPGAFFGMGVGGPLADDMTRPTGGGALFGAIAVDAFMEPADFHARMDEALAALRATRRSPGVERIRIPGDAAAGLMAKRRSEGIPLPDAVVLEFQALGRAAGVPFPAPCPAWKPGLRE